MKKEKKSKYSEAKERKKEIRKKSRGKKKRIRRRKEIQNVLPLEIWFQIVKEKKMKINGKNMF